MGGRARSRVAPAARRSRSSCPRSSRPRASSERPIEQLPPYRRSSEQGLSDLIGPYCWLLRRWLMGHATLRASERCPSGLRSATGNRVRAERCVAGSNPALSAEFEPGPPSGVRPLSDLDLHVHPELLVARDGAVEV